MLTLPGRLDPVWEAAARVMASAREAAVSVLAAWVSASVELETAESAPGALEWVALVSAARASDSAASVSARAAQPAGPASAGLDQAREAQERPARELPRALELQVEEEPPAQEAPPVVAGRRVRCPGLSMPEARTATAPAPTPSSVAFVAASICLCCE